MKSLSDNTEYPDFCLLASADDHLFRSFRRNKVYTKILEHVTPEQGAGYLALIKENSGITKEDLINLSDNDRFGNPERFQYDDLVISPSTLRYIKVLTDLQNMFGDLRKLKICEIGVGYGGQCRVLSSSGYVGEYTLVDIRQALLLARKYLESYILLPELHYLTMDELPGDNYDLVISNYAFTELPGNLQRVYLEKVISRSEHGYITYNDIVPEYYKSIKKDELLKIIPGSRIFDEIPLTHEKNCIIAW